MSYDITYMWNLKKRNKCINYKIEVDSHRKQTYGYQRERFGRGIYQEYVIKIHTILYLKQITNRNPLYSEETYTQYLVIRYNGREWKKENTTETLHCPPETNTTLYMIYVSINFLRNKKIDKYFGATNRQHRNLQFSSVQSLSRV